MFHSNGVMQPKLERICFVGGGSCHRVERMNALPEHFTPESVILEARGEEGQSKEEALTLTLRL